MSDASVPDTEIATGLAGVRARIAAACTAAGRAADAVHLIAVSKTKPQSAVLAALRAGQRLFGENRVQEAAAKFPPLRDDWPAMRLHIIGGLQTNKAREAVRIADTIQTLDRPRLAEALAEAIQREGRHPDLMVEVNLGDEPQKSGIPRAEADAFIAACQARFGAHLVGLMGVPPAAEDPAPHFLWLAEAARRHGIGQLSIGMSADFEAAIAAGATCVRVGSAIFGGRPVPPGVPGASETASGAAPRPTRG